MSALNATSALNSTVQPDVTSELSRPTVYLHDGNGIESHGETPNALVIGLLVTVGMLASSLVLVLGYLCRKRCERAATHVCALLRPAPYPAHGLPGCVLVKRNKHFKDERDALKYDGSRKQVLLEGVGKFTNGVETDTLSKTLVKTLQDTHPYGAVWQDGSGTTFDQTVTVTLRDRHQLESEERLLLRFTIHAAPMPPARVTGRRQRPSDAGAPPLVVHDPGPALLPGGRAVVDVRVDAESQYLVPVARPAAGAGGFGSEASLQPHLPHLPPRPTTVGQARRFNQHRRATRSNSEPSST